MLVRCNRCNKEYRVTNLDQLVGDYGQIDCSDCGAQTVFPISGAAPVAPSASATDMAAQSGGSQRRFGLTPRLVTIMLLISLVPVAAFGYLTYISTGDRIKTETAQRYTEIGTGLVGHVDEWLDKNIRMLEAAAQMPALIEMKPNDQVPVLKALQAKYPWAYLVFTTDAEGINIARSDGKRLTNYSDRTYFKAVRSGKAVAWQNLIGKTSKKPALVLAVPIRRNGEIVGVLASAMTRDDLSERIATWRQGKSGYAFLVDESGKLLAHPDSALTTSEKNMADHPLIKTATAIGEMLEFQGPDGRLLLGQSRQTQLGWWLAVVQDEAEAYQDLRAAQHNTLILLAVTMVVVFGIALLSGRAITNPIRSLIHAADQMSMGDLEVSIKRKRSDEIGDLADALGRMQDSLKISLQRLRRKSH